MATKEQILDAIAEMSVLELSELLKDFEEKFGVTAAAPVAVAVAPADDAGADAGGSAGGGAGAGGSGKTGKIGSEKIVFVLVSPQKVSAYIYIYIFFLGHPHRILI